MNVGAIFDWDGVLIDSSAYHEAAWERLAKERGLPLPVGHFKRGFGMKNEVIIPKIRQWGDQPELVQMADQRCAKFSRANHCLNLRLCDVHVHTDIVRLCQVAAADNEGIAAMMWDGRSERGMQPIGFKRPILNQRAAGREACVIRCTASTFWRSPAGIDSTSPGMAR